MAEYGNRGGRRVDAHGDPILESYNAAGAFTGTGTGAHTGAETYETSTGTGLYRTDHPQGGAVAGPGGGHGQLMPERERGLRRSSSSSSSSSSEDDGMGGRRKKGIKEKVKEKMPGGHKTEGHHGSLDDQTAPATTTGMTAEGGHEKKGVMEKIKEKLPGGH